MKTCNAILVKYIISPNRKDCVMTCLINGKDFEKLIKKINEGKINIVIPE